MTVPTGFPLADAPLIGTWPRVLWQVAWTTGGNTASPNHWYTVSKRLRGKWRADLSGRQYELDTAQAGTAALTLDSLDGAYDPDNTSSPYYPYVLPYRRMRLLITTTPTQNLLYPWTATGTSTESMASSTGTTSATTSGLPASVSGLTSAQTWTIPNGTSSGAAFGLWGDVQPWTSHDCEGTTATPGAPYAAAIDVQLDSGGMTSLTLAARIGWYGLDGTLISHSTGTTTAITTSWARLTVSDTAPSGAAFAIVSLATTEAVTADTTVHTTAWQLEQADAPTAYADPGTWSQLWQGYAESFIQRYDQNGKYSTADITGVDALSPLSRLTLGDTMPAWLAATGPQYTFDLAATDTSPDVPGGTAFLDTAGTGAALDITGSAITTGVSITSATGPGILWNVPGPVITLTNDQAASLGNSSGATYLQPWTGSTTVMLPTSGGWSRLICFRTTLTPGTSSTYTLATLWAATNTDFLTGSGSSQDGAYLYINSDGHVGMNVQRADGTNLVAINPTQVCDGDWHCAIASLSADGTTIQVTVDDTLWINSSGSDLHGTTYTQDAVATLLVGSTVNAQPFNGDLAYFAQWDSELDASTRDSLARGFAQGWAGDSIGTRLVNTLALSDFHAGAASDYAYVGTLGYLGSVTTRGKSPLQIIQSGADTENGQFVISRLGVPTLFGHLWRWIQSTPRVTFGEDTAAGEIPYAGDITFTTDTAHLYNDVQITCDGAPDATDTTRVQEASDSTSQAAYFPQTLTRTINPDTVSSGRDIADYLLSQYKDPHTRVGQITIDLATSPTRQAAVARLAFSDLVRVVRRPALAPTKQLDGFIEQLQWSGDDTGAVLQLRAQISPASQYRYWMISAAWATLTADATAGTDTITLGPISGNSDIPAQYVLPAGHQLTLGYGTAAAETVTVQSVATVSAGYTSVTVTLTATLTSNHTSGDTACSPEPSNVTVPPSPATYPTCFDDAAAFGGTSPLIGF
ncbi:hypothetical protein [Streptomyces sp. MUM 16J]|uniref:hypothetical protein n=1 Tax=Streptomyces sp. MUM 16J TaxID=2791988 RepID=UPI001F046DA7|nr:hypothetical protein [Streptomyces sp. MUM 16J]MCH0555821.1 hypothetical protein [Streptomyces sp. MUM 16J]